MDSMFEGATAFNQPLAFNTSKVTSVRVYICFESDHCKKPILISYQTFLLDEQHVQRGNGLQPVTIFQ